MKEKIKHYAKELIFFVIFLTLITNIMSFYKSQELNSAPLQISTLKLLNNSIYTVEQDKPILLHFWATWCPTCKLEASNINFLAKDFNIITIAVNSGSNEDIQKYLDENNYDFLVVNDAKSILSSKFHIAGFPTTFIYNKDKKLVFSEVGYTSIIGLYLRMWWAGF